MKLFSVLVLLSLLAISYANIAEKVFSDPEHPGKCVRKGEIISPGEEVQPDGKCEVFMCKRDDGFGTVLSCDTQQIKPGCQLGDQLEPHGVFPNCCARHVVCE